MQYLDAHIHDEIHKQIWCTMPHENVSHEFIAWLMAYHIMIMRE